MWKKNLLLAALLLAGSAAMAKSLFRPAREAGTRPFFAQPRSDDFDSAVQAVDAAFAQAWAVTETTPSVLADDLTIARRAALALVGSIPSLEEIRRLEATPSELRQAAWIDRLLADPRTGDYLAERLARPLVGVDGGPFLLYRRRRFVSWLSDELHQSAPFDVIVRRIIADSGLWTDRPATNFITVALTAEPNDRPDVDVLAGRVMQGVLGERLACAQCHDHPFKPEWKQAHFQSVAAFFGQTRRGFTGIYDVDEPYSFADPMTGELREIAPAVPFAAECLPAEGTARQRLAAWATDPRNGAFARATVNRIWALVVGRPLIEPVDDIPLEGPWPPGLEILADDFASHGYDVHRLIRIIAATAPFRASSENDAAPSASDESSGAISPNWSVFPLTRLRPEQVVGSLTQAASLTTLDRQAHILLRIARHLNERNFIERYGDAGERELEQGASTIPQRLLMLNGELIHERTKDDLFFNAATRIGVLAPDDVAAVEAAYLTVLTRRPTAAERDHFAARLAGMSGGNRNEALADLFWTLMNATEFSWNH